MPVLDPNDPVFGALPSTFTSPFPSEESQASSKFAALASGKPSYLSRLQAESWQNVTHLTMRELATSRVVGGLRQALVNELIYTEPKGVGGADVLRGLFAQASFPDAVSPAAMFEAAADVGLQAAIDFGLSAVPVVGKALGAAVAIGKWMAQLKRASEEELKAYAPWVDYKRDTDTDLVNVFLMGDIAGKVEWSAVWEPPFHVNGSRWSIMETTQPGENRSYGVWGTGEKAEPRYVAGALGAMPGTQRIADRIQVARLYGKIGQNRRDAVTNCGAYFPAAAQWATVAWGMCNKMGSADAFKVQPARLDGLWHTYFMNFFADGFAELDYHRERQKGGNEHWVSALFLAKAMLSTVVTPDGTIGLDANWIANGGNFQSFVDRELLNDDGQNRVKPGMRLRCPYPAIIKPALEKLKLRQLRMLARTPVCAYVRHEDVGNLPAFAAFKDPGPPLDGENFATWGEELTAFCVFAREQLLTHRIRYTVRDADVFAIDPPYAEKLAATKGIAPELDIKVREEPLAEVDDPPDASPPEGGAPFEVTKATIIPPEKKRTAMWIIGGTAAAAAAGTGGYFAWKALR